MAGPYEDVMQYVTNVCNAYIGSGVSAIANAIAPAGYTLLGVYVILWAFASMRGMIEEPIMEALVRILKITFIFGVGIKLAQYNVYVVDVFVNGPDQLAQSLLNGAASAGHATTMNGLDKVLEKGFTIGKSFWDKGGILNGDFGMYLIAIFCWGLTILVTAYACFLLALSHIAIALLIALGPLFIISLLFKTTESFFTSWVQQLSNYAILIVLVVSANLFILTMFSRASDTITGISDSLQIDQVFPFMITGLISVLVLAQLPSLASGLAGGLSLSSYGVGRLAMKKLTNISRNLVPRRSPRRNGNGSGEKRMPRNSLLRQ